MSTETNQRDEVAAYRRTNIEVLSDLQSDERRGLTEADANARFMRYGRNEVTPERPVPSWRKFLAQFQDVLVILLLVATTISAALWLYERESPLPYEAMAIFAVVSLNAAMGYIQESRAESAVAALRQMTASTAHIIREGRQREVPAAQLVPGDIILVEEGYTVPADARVIQATSLQVAEAALTGESLSTSKNESPIAWGAGIGDRHNMIFSGTSVTYGRGRAVVVATGMHTEMGHIAGMLGSVPKETTPLQKELNRIGKLLGLLVIITAVVMIATIIIVERVSSFSAIVDVLILGVALAVAAVPEGLPAIVTTVLSIGVERMARRRAIIRHLAAVETLGSADVIASDKTGTLTKNEMTVREIVTANGRVSLEGTGYVPQGDISRHGGGQIDGPLKLELQSVLVAADRANNALLQECSGHWIVHGDPTEGALVVAARKAGLESEVLAARFKRVGEIPFSSERKLMSTIHTDVERQGVLLIFTKGAPDVLLTRCSRELLGENETPLSDGRRKEILSVNEALAGHALRTLGVAYRSMPGESLEGRSLDEHFEHELVFAGLVGMIDPPREEARAAVACAKSAGIRPIMITGDHPKTAEVIACELGIGHGERAITGAELRSMSDDEIAETVQKAWVYARVNPEDKLRIVRALRQHGAIVAMTGDGVNDAPALKTADIGVAMGTGTDVAKEAADMVLADDNFATIVAAVEEGRSIFRNIRKFLQYLLSSNIGEVMTMFFGVVLAKTIGLRAEGGQVMLPLLATQLLWINLVTDGAPALALGMEPPDPGVMSFPPRPANERVITKDMWLGIFSIATLMAAGTLFVLDTALPGGFAAGSGSMKYAQTMAFTTLVLFQLFNALNARSGEQSVFEGIFRNQWLWAAIGLSLALQVAVIYTPFLQQAFSTVSLDLADWFRCATVASSVLWLHELSKVAKRAAAIRHRDH